jgi:phosphoribosylformylglycinamidine synthase subunit PurS
MGFSMKARVFVSLKPTVLDPQGQTICSSLNAHGHPMITGVRQGKYFDIAVAPDIERTAAEAEIRTIAGDVLANPVIEDYQIEFID